MSLPDPRNAARRHDLPFLRRRVRPTAAPTAAPVIAPVTTAAAGGASLDLSPATPAQPAAAPRPADTPAREHPVNRAHAGANVLTSTAPTLTLTRLQSGIGALTMEARCGDDVGDLRLGCAYQLRSGRTSTVQPADGRDLAPHGSTRPVIVARRERSDQISLDLRQCREIERLIVYGYSERGMVLRWGGALVVTTFGGARIELPLDGPPSHGVRVILSLYNIRGEFVLRSELETVNGSARDACRAYGFDRITWLDGHTPLD